MRRLLHITTALRRRWPLLALLTLYGYLSVHTLSGEQGVMKWVDYEDDAVRLSARLDSLTRTREALETDADALSSSALQLDVLDQRARDILYASRPDELVLPH